MMAIASGLESTSRKWRPLRRRLRRWFRCRRRSRGRCRRGWSGRGRCVRGCREASGWGSRSFLCRWGDDGVPPDVGGGFAAGGLFGADQGGGHVGDAVDGVEVEGVDVGVAGVPEDVVVLGRPAFAGAGAVVVGPDDLVLEAGAAEDRVEHDLAVVYLARVDVEEERAVGGEDAVRFDHAGTEEADEVVEAVGVAGGLRSGLRFGSGGRRSRCGRRWGRERCACGCGAETAGVEGRVDVDKRDGVAGECGVRGGYRRARSGCHLVSHRIGCRRRLAPVSTFVVLVGGIRGYRVFSAATSKPCPNPKLFTLLRPTPGGSAAKTRTRRRRLRVWAPISSATEWAGRPRVRLRAGWRSISFWPTFIRAGGGGAWARRTWSRLRGCDRAVCVRGRRAVCMRLFIAANQAVFERSGTVEDMSGMGTTLVALLYVPGPEKDRRMTAREPKARFVAPPTLFLANVGDSRCYGVGVESSSSFRRITPLWGNRCWRDRSLRCRRPFRRCGLHHAGSGTAGTCGAGSRAIERRAETCTSWRRTGKTRELTNAEIAVSRSVYAAAQRRDLP